MHQRPGGRDRRLFRPGRAGHRRSAADGADGRRRLELRAGERARPAARSTPRSTCSRGCSSTSARPAADADVAAARGAARNICSSAACSAGCPTARSADALAVPRLPDSLALRRRSARLDYLRDAGVEPDERMDEAIEIVESKRDADGRWPLEHAYHDELLFELGETRGQAEPMDHAAGDAGAALGGRCQGGCRRPHRHDGHRVHQHRPGQRGALRGPPDGLRCARERGRSASASGTSSRHGRLSSRIPAEERARRLREQTHCGTADSDHDERPRRLPRRRARRLVRGRAAHGVRGPPARLPRPMGGPVRGQDRRQRVGGDLRVRPRGVPAARHRLRARAGGRRLRARTRRSRAGGIPDDHAAGRGRSPGASSTWAPAACSPLPGSTEVADPTPRRVVMRIDFQSGTGTS